MKFSCKAGMVIFGQERRRFYHSGRARLYPRSVDTNFEDMPTAQHSLPATGEGMASESTILNDSAKSAHGGIAVGLGAELMSHV